MITLENRFFPLRTAVCFFVEGGIIVISVFTSVLLLNNYRGFFLLTMQDVLFRGLIIALICQACMYVLDLYDLRYRHSWGEIFFTLLFAVGVVCIGLGGISYFFPEFGIGGEIYYLTVFFVSVFLLCWRIIFNTILSRYAPVENILIVGSGDVAVTVAKEIRMRERMGFRFKGFVVSTESGDGNIGVGPYIGGYSELPELVQMHKIKKVVVALAERRGEYPVKEMLALRASGCSVIEWPAFFEKLAGRIPIDNLTPSFFIFNDGFRKSKFILTLRRAISFLVAIVGLFVLSPLILLIGLLILIDSPGPLIYSQNRVGQNGKPIKIHKFRSMVADAEKENGPVWAEKDDPRVTRIGWYLRKARFDEIPQLINVLKGDIDLVGPRPERPEFVEKLQSMFPYYSLRHTVKPGLTGWAQVMFQYCGTIEESKEKLQFDLFYIKNMSVKLDLFIIFQTIKIVIIGRGSR